MAKPYVVRYLQLDNLVLFTLFEGTVKYTNFASRYTKKIATGVFNNYWKFFPLVREILPPVFDLWRYFTNFGGKNLNNDLDASHYLYIMSQIRRGAAATTLGAPGSASLHSHSLHRSRTQPRSVPLGYLISYANLYN